MKTRIVMWGNNEKDQKVLIAISLRAEDNIVDLFTFPFESTSEEFYNLMLNEWREAHEVPFPEGYTHTERPLTASNSLLPDNLKVDRPDIIQRAQTEWHFLVLSNKLYHSFLSELEDIKDKIKGATSYKNQLWEEMKESWEKIQKNIFDKTLLREHGQQLREMTNDIFTQLKNMRKDMDSEIDRVSHAFADKFNTKLDEVEQKIKSGLGLQPLFNDLKHLQQEFKDADLSRNDRSKIWKRIDAAFKQVKEKKFGEKSSKDTSALDRLSRRYEGLLSAIEKMDKSIKRDDKDKSFQDDRIANTEGQLEAQIRMAKLKMIDERIHSKNEKLAEMQKTKGELEERINREKKFLEEQKKQQTMKVELNEAKESVKQKIADSIHAQADHLDADALGKAAEAIAESKAKKQKKEPKETLLDAISGTLGESLTDLGDNLGAIASVVSDKIEDAVKDLNTQAKEKIENIKETLNDMEKNKKEEWDDVNETPKGEKTSDESSKESLFDSITDKMKDLGEDLGTVTSNLVEKLEHAMKDIHVKEIVEDFKENLKEMHVKEKLEDFADNIKETASHLTAEAKEKLEELKNKMKKDDKSEDEKSDDSSAT
ncbi:MAG TPA: hypothetical protein VFG10_05955 [Saprospiraceae bacterium]|nr:hypothetical protein [Saprospiraceae bacterium]